MATNQVTTEFVVSGDDVKKALEDVNNLLEEVGDSAAETAEQVSELNERFTDADDKLEKSSKGGKNAANSFRLMGKSMTAAGVASDILTKALDALIGAVQTAWKEGQRLQTSETNIEAILQATGSAAGKTSEDIKGLATSLSDLTRFSRGELMEGMQLMTAFPKVAGDEFDRASAVALDFASVWGRSVPDAMRAVGKALNDPRRGLELLQEAGIAFTAQELELIRTLDDAGRTAEAQDIILRRLEERFGGVAEAAGKDAVGQIKQFENALTDAFAEGGVLIFKFIEGFSKTSGEVENATDVLRELRDAFEDARDQAVIYGAAAGKVWLAQKQGIQEAVAWIKLANGNVAGYVSTMLEAGKTAGQIASINEKLAELAEKQANSAKETQQATEETVTDVVEMYSRLEELDKKAEDWKNKIKTARDNFNETKEIVDELVKSQRLSNEEGNKALEMAWEEFRVKSGIVKAEEEAEKAREKAEKEADKRREERKKKEEKAADDIRRIWEKNNPFSEYIRSAEEVQKAVQDKLINPRMGAAAIRELRRQMAMEAAKRFGRESFQSEMFTGVASVSSRIQTAVGKIKSPAEKLAEDALNQDKDQFNKTYPLMQRIERNTRGTIIRR